MTHPHKSAPSIMVNQLPHQVQGNQRLMKHTLHAASAQQPRSAIKKALQVFRSLMDADSADYTDLVPASIRRLSLKASAAHSSEAEDSPTTPAGPKGANPLSMPSFGAVSHKTEHVAGCMCLQASTNAVPDVHWIMGLSAVHQPGWC